MAILKLEDISLTYVNKEGTFPALQHVSLHVKEGEFVSLLGPSGCGKTTLLSIIAGLLEPIEGTRTIIHPKEATTDIGYMLQHDYLFPWLSIEENITLGQRIRGIYDFESKQNALKWLDAFQLTDKKKEFPRALSGGMRQRIALIRMLATNPAVVLLDEPFSALDQQTKLKLENLVSKTLKKENKTTILVTHDIGEAIAMSDRIVLLTPRPGKVEQIFEIPSSLKQQTPFDTRQDPMFQQQFQLIWKELERLDQS
ncbi:ABC transporter ATP-binding protein [Bacillus sp. FSL W7-1360]